MYDGLRVRNVRLDPLGRSLQCPAKISLPPRAVEFPLELVKGPGIVAGKQDAPAQVLIVPFGR